jgi:D-xylose transport system permease protein
MSKYLKSNATLIALIILGIGISLLSPEFITTRNLTNLTRQVTIVGIMSVGMTMVILTGGIDLSVGSVMGIAAIVVTLLMQSGLNVFLAILLTLLSCGGIIGFLDGFWIAYYRIPPFIITLGMMTIARGLALTLSNGSSISVTDTFFLRIGGDSLSIATSVVLFILAILAFFVWCWRDLQRKKAYNIALNTRESSLKAAAGLLIIAFFGYVLCSYQGIPIPVAIFVIITFGGMIVLNKTRFGRRIYAIGGNEEAARLSGIDVKQTKLYVYIVMSVLSALSGILLASRLNGASPNFGNNAELDAIASVVIGGTSLSGGFGTIGGSIVGTFIIGVLNNGMSLLGVNMFYQLMVKGVIIIMAVWFDILNKNKK